MLFLRISHADGLNRATGVRGYIEESRSGGTGIFGPARINLGVGFIARLNLVAKNFLVLRPSAQRGLDQYRTQSRKIEYLRSVR